MEKTTGDGVKYTVQSIYHRPSQTGIDFKIGHLSLDEALSHLKAAIKVKKLAAITDPVERVKFLSEGD